MNEKILQLLKQAYSSLGLGDSLLKAYADNLATFATEENVESIVAAQKATLEAIQKSNDKRASDAVSKAKAEADNERKSIQSLFEHQKNDMQREIDELKAKLETKPKEEPKKEEPKAEPQKTEPNNIPDWFTAEQQKMAAQLKAVLENNKTLTDVVTALKKENEDYKVAQAKEERAKFISKTAKEVGVPQWRESEGFNITDQMTEDEIKTYLTGVSNNIRVNMVGENKLGVPQLGAGGKVPEEQIKKIASDIVSQI